MISLKEKIIFPHWLPKVAIIFFINLALVSSVYAAFRYAYQDRIYPGVYVGSYSLNGKTFDEAQSILNGQIDKFTQEGFTFTHNGQKAIVYPIMTSDQNDLAYELIKLDTDKTVEDAFNYGRSDNFFTNLRNTLNTLIFGERIAFTYSINKDQLQQELKDNFTDSEVLAENASFFYKDSQIAIQKEKIGSGINYDKGIKGLELNLAQLENKPVELFTEDKLPQVYTQDLAGHITEAGEILKATPITLKYRDNKWEVKKEKLITWLDFDADGASLNKEKIKNYLQDKVVPKVNKEPAFAKMQIVDGRATQFEPGQDGVEVKLDETAQKIEDDFLKNKATEIEIAVGEIKNDINTADVNNLGLKEIIGTGESNFAGSPPNRIHNIKTGAAAVNGTLIKPGEEFSLLKTLGKIDGTTGYLQELVIKNNKTVPEYGGGLCQIGTTVFRGSLASGLPITQRQNHSYRVTYYEPAGTDATIYDPWPDFKFINDTGNYVLIQSRMEGTKLFFDFWGTKDGRVASSTYPTIHNIVKPAPPKLIETLDLPVGKKKCTEKAHNGADAYFDYQVTYPNGEVKQKRFSSHYVPWQEVCLIGVEKLSDKTSATSTPTQSQ